MAKILIVDDSNLARRTLRKILEAVGHEVIEAVDGFTALEQYAVQRPHLVFLDLSMPGMQGADVMTKLIEMDEKACVIIATADIQDITRAEIIRDGAVGFLNKPFTPEAVLQALNSVLAAERRSPG